MSNYRALDEHIAKNGSGKPLVQTFIALRNEIASLKVVVANQEKRIRELETKQPAEILPAIR